MLPRARPLSRPLGRMVRLPSNRELARTHTTASGRSRSRLTRHGAGDDTMCKSCYISMQRARTHALACAPSCTGLRSGSAPTLDSRSPHAPTTYARLQPNLPTAGLQQPRAARRAWSPLEKIDRRMVSRPSCLPTQRRIGSGKLSGQGTERYYFSGIARTTRKKPESYLVWYRDSNSGF